MPREVPYPHPGEILSEEFLTPLGISAYRLAKAGQMLVSARADAIRAHEELFKVGQERGDLVDQPKPGGAIERFEAAVAA